MSTNLLPPDLAQIQFVDYRKPDRDAAFRLVRALTAIPPPKPLPDPLPLPPEVPPHASKPELPSQAIEARRKANEEKKETRAQRRPRIMAYDVFISFKNLDENGVPTRDADLANEVYKFLTSKGLRVFISTVMLESLGVSDYKKAIDDALDAASIMVAVGTSTENLDSRWVRYEWDGFYHDILSGVKPGGKLFTYVAGLRPAEPRTLRQTQTFIHSPQSLGQLHGFIVQALR